MGAGGVDMNAFYNEWVHSSTSYPSGVNMVIYEDMIQIYLVRNQWILSKDSGTKIFNVLKWRKLHGCIRTSFRCSYR
jgi:hypothetical protein